MNQSSIFICILLSILLSACSSRPFKVISTSKKNIEKKSESSKSEFSAFRARFPSSAIEKGCFPLMKEFILKKDELLADKMQKDYLIDNDFLSFDDYDWASGLSIIKKKYKTDTKNQEYAALILGILKKDHPEWDERRILRKFNALSSFCHS
ncbi:hypothetical protein OAT67_04855 [Bacteriovoracaceae bacterium]|nr:hypothetical protein [Bacteriovoracaceae bacterium]